MGLERVAAVLQHVHSNYEIDLFQHLIAASATAINCTDVENPSLKVIADHIRSCAFMIVDGVLPSNEGRGYVLRRIIRRALRHGHKLGATDVFFHKLVAPLVKEMGAAYPELRKAADHVSEQLLLEEQRFARTLSSGLKILDDEIARLNGTEIPGDVVFKLYDTYGFPQDLTADIARERELTLDVRGFDAAMEGQRARARAASQFNQSALQPVATDTRTEFLGYGELTATATIAQIYVGGGSVDKVTAGTDALIILDQTPFYGESGGQVGDTGTLATDSAEFAVVDTQKQKAAFIHAGAVVRGELVVGETLKATVDEERRHKIRQHHSATHLLHGGLRAVLGQHVEQRGSLVNDEHLRFDFSHTGPMSDAEIQAVERWIDNEVRANSPCETIETSMDEAKSMGAMALFGEKYGERVRVVKLGDRSVELCGGTHVAATGELGVVKVTTETGVAAGVRRIEALSGERGMAHVQAVESQLMKVASLLKTSTTDVVSKLEQLQTKQRDMSRQLEQLQAKLSAGAGKALASNAVQVGAVALLTEVVENADAKALRTIIDHLRQELPTHAILLASEHDGKATLVASVSKGLHGELKAGDVVREAAGVLGGRGGGRADLAQGGAPSLDQVCAAFAAVRALTEKQLGA